MELISLQKASEELLEQLNQLKEFSNKYRENSRLTEDAILRSTEIMSASGENMVQITQLVNTVEAAIKTESERLHVLELQVGQQMNELGVTLHEKSESILQNLQRTFLDDQNRYLEGIQNKWDKTISVLEGYTYTINDNLEKAAIDTKELQTNAKQDILMQQAKLNKETGERIDKIEATFSDHIRLISESIHEMRMQISQTLETINQEFSARMTITEKQNSNFVEDIKNKLDNNVQELNQQQNKYFFDSIKQQTEDKETIFNEIHKLKANFNRGLVFQLFQLLLFFVVIGILFVLTPY